LFSVFFLFLLSLLPPPPTHHLLPFDTDFVVISSGIYFTFTIDWHLFCVLFLFHFSTIANGSNCSFANILLDRHLISKLDQRCQCVVFSSALATAPRQRWLTTAAASTSCTKSCPRAATVSVQFLRQFFSLFARRGLDRGCGPILALKRVELNAPVRCAGGATILGCGAVSTTYGLAPKSDLVFDKRSCTSALAR
jgi:hypothetical protein